MYIHSSRGQNEVLYYEYNLHVPVVGKLLNSSVPMSIDLVDVQV